MVVAVVVVLVKMNILLFFSIVVVERLLVALTFGRGRFKVGNAPSFNDLREG